MNMTYDFSQTVIVNVDISMWSGRARLGREDLDANVVDQLPPQALASLGSKKLIDPDCLKPLVAIKSKMFKYMNNRGQRFLSGWLIHESTLQTVTDNLQAMAQEFEAARAVFVSDYNANTAAWIQSYPEWVDLLRNALPTAAEIERRFSFTFQCFRLSPEDTGCKNDDLDTRIAGVGDTVIADIASQIAAARRDIFKDKREKFSQRSCNVFTEMMGKLTSLSFVHPNLGKIRGFLSDLYDRYSTSGGNPADVAQFKIILDHLSDAHNLEEFACEYADGRTSISMLDTLAPATAQTTAVQTISAAPELSPVFATITTRQATPAVVEESKPDVLSILDETKQMDPTSLPSWMQNLGLV